MTIVLLLVALVHVFISQAQRTLLDYNLTGTSIVFNAVDGKSQIVSGDTSLVLGPGQTRLGYYPNAVDFGSTGRIENINFLWESQNFVATVIFRVNNEIEGRQNLFESFPFSLSVIKTVNQGEFTFLPGVCLQEYSWQGTTTTTGVINGRDWHTVDLLYGEGVLSLNVNGSQLAQRAFERKELFPHSLYPGFVIATWGGTRFHFYGQIAAVQLVDRTSIGTTTSLSTISTVTFGTTTETSGSEKPTPHKMNVGAIVGIVIGCASAIVTICFLLLFLRYRKQVQDASKVDVTSGPVSGQVTADSANIYIQPQPTTTGMSTVVSPTSLNIGSSIQQLSSDTGQFLYGTSSSKAASPMSPSLAPLSVSVSPPVQPAGNELTSSQVQFVNDLYEQNLPSETIVSVIRGLLSRQEETGEGSGSTNALGAPPAYDFKDDNNHL